MDKITVIGGKGFIGNELVHYLKKKKYNVYVSGRNDKSIFTQDLGTVVYCAGYGNCSEGPFDVLQSNTDYLSSILQKATFKRIIYLSSTRLYMGSESSREDSNVKINTDDNRRLFNLTKLVSEELCFLSGRDAIVVRPSNVYGLALDSNLYLPSITRKAIQTGRVDMYVSPGYSKDYVSVKTVVSAIEKLIAHKVKHNLYNIASGYNTSAREISEILLEHIDCSVTWHEVNIEKEDKFPETNIERLNEEFDVEKYSVNEDLPLLIQNFKNVLA